MDGNDNIQRALLILTDEDRLAPNRVEFEVDVVSQWSERGFFRSLVGLTD